MPLQKTEIMKQDFLSTFALRKGEKTATFDIEGLWEWIEKQLAEVERKEYLIVRDVWIDMQKLVVMFGNEQMGRAVDAYKTEALKQYHESQNTQINK